ncbi:MAG: immunity 26/phosphotriesterase HocA family protein [Acidobacteriota bacterium]|nr:immunity 26/phosphotriesterase HocA family protein [Acidobacteriota bacterium]
MKGRNFPHIPKTTKTLLPGDFWSIPLDDGQFACGRVIGYCRLDGKQQLKLFFAGLLDWVSDMPPTSAAIAGAATCMQGGAHLQTILITGGTILGNRPLELDGIQPEYFIEYPDNMTPTVFLGMESIRVATPKDIQTLPTLSIFGNLAMWHFANECLRRKPNKGMNRTRNQRASHHSR